MWDTILDRLVKSLSLEHLSVSSEWKERQTVHRKEEQRVQMPWDESILDFSEKGSISQYWLKGKRIEGEKGRGWGQGGSHEPEHGGLVCHDKGHASYSQCFGSHCMSCKGKRYDTVTCR